MLLVIPLYGTLGLDPFHPIPCLFLGAVRVETDTVGVGSDISTSTLLASVNFQVISMVCPAMLTISSHTISRTWPKIVL